MKVHYKNLDGLRCIAACTVIVSHVEQLKKDNGLNSVWSLNSPVFLYSKLGVDLFFVLSGFLITSLLLNEKSKYNTISIRNFYIKRMLRIWPLYFLLIGLSLLVFPKIDLLHYASNCGSDGSDHFAMNVLLFLIFMPNVQTFLYGPVLYCGQTWSIGLEEQYYLVWPWIMRRVKSLSRLKITVIAITGAMMLLKLSLLLLARHHKNEHLISAVHFIKHYPIHTILFGCYFAIINKGERLKNLLTTKWMQIVVYPLTLVLLALKVDAGGFYWELYAVFFGIIILNLVNARSIVNLEYFPFTYIGKISYGMYMYHFVIIAIVIRGITHTSWLIYIISFALTIIVSALSFELFERRLLTFKDKLTARAEPAKNSNGASKELPVHM